MIAASTSPNANAKGLIRLLKAAPSGSIDMAICPKLNPNSVINSIVDDVDWCESFGTAVGGHGCEFIKTCPVYAKLKMAAIVKEDLVTDARDCSNPFKEAMQELR